MLRRLFVAHPGSRGHLGFLCRTPGFVVRLNGVIGDIGRKPGRSFFAGIPGNVQSFSPSVSSSPHHLKPGAMGLVRGARARLTHRCPHEWDGEMRGFGKMGSVVLSATHRTLCPKNLSARSNPCACPVPMWTAGSLPREHRFCARPGGSQAKARETDGPRSDGVGLVPSRGRPGADVREVGGRRGHRGRETGGRSRPGRDFLPRRLPAASWVDRRGILRGTLRDVKGWAAVSCRVCFRTPAPFHGRRAVFVHVSLPADGRLPLFLSFGRGACAEPCAEPCEGTL